METLDLSEGCDECEDVSELCLVGKILNPKILNRTAISNILQSAWKPRSQLVISPWGDNVYLFQFSKSEDRCKVLAKAPWSVMGNLLVLQPLHLGMAISDFDFRWCPFWVQVHGLPLDKMSKKHGESIRNHLGKLIEFKALSDGLLLGRSFLRIRVELDVTKPLLQGFILHRRTLSGEPMTDFRVFYKYEKLSDFCYDCGRIRHDNTSCKFISRADGTNSGYGPAMRIGVVKHIGAPHGTFQRSHVEGLNADSLVRRSPVSPPLAYHPKAGGGSRDSTPVPTAGVPVRGESEAAGILSCMPPQNFTLPQDTTCLSTPNGLQNVTPLSANGPTQEVSPGFGLIPHVPHSLKPTLVGFSVRPCGPSPGSSQLGSTSLVSNAGPLGADEPSKPKYFVTEPTNSPSSLGAPSSPSHSNSLNSGDSGRGR
ncbi:hypothetical protein CsSME_00019872 [Camellia sinensis var. sinensis]